ncbi:MAG TPA: TMEM14 family protein [Coleofasciculaceae cyanobacterium]
MSAAALSAIIYGILAIGGGILGYVKVKSQQSLISGVISGILLLVGGIGQLQAAAWGLPLSIAVTLVLITVFAIRLAKTRKFMPAGLMIIAGLVALAGMVLKLA